MSFDQLLLAGVAIGLILVLVTFFVGRKEGRRPRAVGRTRTAPGDLSTLPPEPNDPETGAASDDPVARLAETVNALRRLAELQDQELERDAAVREEVRTGWRPISEQPSEPTTRPRSYGQREPHGGSRRSATGPESPVPPIVTEVAQVRLDPSTKMHPDSASKLRLSVGQAFSPAAPVSRRDLFAGRVEQLETLIDVVFERGQHAIVYGERGVGKTSLGTVLALVFAEERTKLPLRVNCDATDSFSSLWQKVVEELEVAVDSWDNDVPTVRTAIERAKSKTDLGPNDVTRFLKQLAPEVELIVLIDEFDTLVDEHAPRTFADTIKMLSDQLVPATLVILGVADTLDELMAEHGSIHRALVHVHMPRMSLQELHEIVKRGLDLLTMDIEDEALSLISYLSQGFPHFTHLLAQAAARSAIDQQRPVVTLEDVHKAMKKVSGRIEAWIEDAYDKATASAHDSIYAQVILASALAHNDERGYFAPADVRAPMSGIMGKTYEIPSFIRQLNALTESDRGPILIKTGAERKHRYRFLEPQLEPYVIMRSITEGVIATDRLGELIGSGQTVSG